MSRTPVDIAGQRFGRLEVVNVVGRSKRGELLWFCRCDCGGSVTATGSNIRTHMKGCGCLHLEHAGRMNRTHGQSGTRLHNIWMAMKQRCYYPKNKRWREYGDRGIRVCDQWKKSFEEFRDWALAHGYADDLSIDRINNNGHYEPGNCRWSDAIGQANNRRPRRKRVLH